MSTTEIQTWAQRVKAEALQRQEEFQQEVFE